MLQFRFPKLLALGALTLGFFSTAFAQEFTPKRVGPVSQYGQLQAGKNAQNEGRIYGSCAAYSTSGNEVQVKGMSLFWSNEKSQNRFWRNDVITGMVSQQGIQVIRAAMAVDDQGWGNGHYFINGKTEYYQDLLDETVQAAIEQDIYVIIDYHSHTAVDNVGRAKEFFKIQAKKWGSYPNVIFEIYNEPICKAGQGHGNSSNCTMITWPEIKAYANEVIPIIRRYSNNLIVVGTPSWSGNPGAVVGNAITGYDNIAYTFHYYAGKNDGTDAHDFNSMSADVNSALGAGLSVFVTEWGTVGYGGDGAPSMANNPQWQTWMNLKKLSSANWNAGRNMTKDGAENSEYFADFDVDNTSPANWTYSASGEWVNANVFNGLSAMTYSQCASYVDLPAVPADDPDFDDSGDDFGDNIYEDEVISHDYVIDDFDGHNSANEYHYFFESGDKGDWTNGNGGESTFFVDGSNVGGVVGVVTGNNGWAGYGVHVETLKGCEEFSYKFRGLAHSFTIGDKVSQSVSGSGGWTTMTFDLTGIGADDLDAPFSIQWQVTGPSSGDSLLIDDVKCGNPIIPVDPNGNTQAMAYLIDDFDGNGRATYDESGNDGYDFVNKTGVWTIGNEWHQPDWCKDETCWEYKKTVYDDAQGGLVAGVWGVVSDGDGGDAHIGVHVPDLEGCATIQYKYKGLPHKFKIYNAPGGANYSETSVLPEATVWTTVRYDVDDATAAGLDLSSVVEIQWSVVGPAYGEGFYVDDVRCVTDDEPVVSYEAYLVADFDGNGTSPYGYLYAYGKSSIGNEWDASCDNGNGCYVMEMASAANSGALGVGMVGITSTDPYGDSGEGAAVLDVHVPNLTGCYNLKYRFQGAAHEVILYDQAGDNANWVGGFSSRTGWKTAMVSLGGQNLDDVTDIRFTVAGQPEPNYLYIDDVECVLEAISPLDDPEDPTTNTELVDDFEDGDMFPLWSVGNYWAESDRGDNGGNTTAQLDVVPGNGGKVLQLTYAYDVGKYAYNPFATISTNDFGNLNLSQCSAIQYDYKGSAHKFRIKVSENVNNLLEMGWGFHTYTVDHPSATWQTVSIPLASLRQEWGKEVPIEIAMQYANGFDWRVEAEDRMSTETGTLSIDNIRCIGLAETRYYTVTFKNGEETLLEKSWAEGSNTYDPGLTPVRAPDPQFTYTFTGWTPSLLDMYWEPVKVTANAVYQAEFDSEIRTYTVTFLMDDGETEYATANAEYDTPVQDILPENPAKDATDEYTYTFNSWSPSVTDAVVTGDMFYVASFGATKKQYSIAFVDVDDETVLKAATLYDYGTPFDEIDAPTVSDNGGWRFAGWTPNPATVTEDVTYRATYTQKFIITWKDDDGSVLRYDYHDAGEIPDYGEDPTKPATAQYSYDFTGWTPAVTDVTGDAVYTATYSAAVNAYEVAFMDDQGEEIIATSSYPYGTQVQTIAPNLSAGDAVWSTAGESCLFTGWNPVILGEAVVTGDKAYTAQCTVVPNKYSITFVMDDGTTLVATVTRDYGTLINDMLPDEPTKTATNAKTFEFARWVTLDGQSIAEDAELEGNTTLKAVFNEFDRMYAVAFVDYDNTVLKPATFYTYGATVEVPDDPTRDPAGVYTYEFSGWSPLVTQVTQEQVYTATYDSTAHYGAIAVSVIDGKKTATIEGSYTDGDVVNIPASIDVDTVVFNRTFSASGYSTITLPFSINRNAIEGVSKVLTFTGIGYDENGKKQVEMEEVNGELSAYKPYMVELSSEGSLVFHGNSMVIQPTEGANTVVQGDDGWEFRGTLSKIVWDEKHPDLGRVYGFSAKEANNVRIGQFVKAGKGAWINPFRAYMIYNEGNSAGKSAGHAYVSAEPLPDYMDVVVVSRGATGEESKTVIGGINTRTGEFKMMQDYDLKGRKLNGKPTARGVYYGKKKIIK